MKVSCRNYYGKWTRLDGYKKRENIRQRNFVNNYFTELTEIQILHASEKTIANDFFYFKYCTSEPVINF